MWAWFGLGRTPSPTPSPSQTLTLTLTPTKASEALAYVRRRADEFGRSWVSLPAAPPAMAHDFCGWLEVSTDT